MKAGALAALEAGHPYLSSHVASCDFSLKLSRPVPDQRRRDAAHYPRCPHLDARAIEGSGAKRPMATGSRTTARRSRCCRFQQSGRASAIRGSKACSYEMTPFRPRLVRNPITGSVGCCARRERTRSRRAAEKLRTAQCVLTAFLWITRHGAPAPLHTPVAPITN